MKKISLFFIFSQIVFFSPYLFAQTAKVVDIKGEVSVRKDISQPWQGLQLDMLLDKEAEVKTQKNSECTLAFDDELMNLLTVKENSQIKIANLKPGEILLPQGKVFSLIDNIENLEEFQIRTPTAIAGVRGTGWSVGFQSNIATVLCFEDMVYILGLDEKGNTTGRKDLASSFGLDIGSGGELGKVFALETSDLSAWNDFKASLENIKASQEEIISLASELRLALSDVFGKEEGFAAVSEFGLPLVGEINIPDQVSGGDITLTEPPSSPPPEVPPSGPFHRIIPVPYEDILGPYEISKPNKLNDVATCATCDQD